MYLYAYVLGDVFRRLWILSFVYKQNHRFLDTTNFTHIQ